MLLLTTLILTPVDHNLQCCLCPFFCIYKKLNSRIFFFLGTKKKGVGGKYMGFSRFYCQLGSLCLRSIIIRRQLPFQCAVHIVKSPFFCKSHINTDLIGVQLKVIEKQKNLLQMLCCFYYTKLFFFLFFSLLSNWAIFKTNIRVSLLKRTKEINSAWWCTQYSDHDSGGIYQ